MIHYAPNFMGLTAIRGMVDAITGNNGLGSPLLPAELLVLGRDFGAPIVLRVGGNSATLAGFLESKLGMEVIPGSSEPEIPYEHWITFHKSMRDFRKEQCAKAIIMSYLACNNFIQWFVNVPQPAQVFNAGQIQFHP